MIISIPGRNDINIKNIIFDYNGTIAVNGEIKESIKENLKKLSFIFNVYVLTADTYGTAKKCCSEIGINILTFPRENASEFKYNKLMEIGKDNTICIGNGFNDIKMCSSAALSIGVIEGEGISTALINSTDILVKSIDDAINILMDKNKIIATLRS